MSRAGLAVTTAFLAAVLTVTALVPLPRPAPVHHHHHARPVWLCLEGGLPGC